MRRSSPYITGPNRFVAGNANSDYVFEELPKGAKTFKYIRRKNFLAVDLIQWDGKYLTNEVPLIHSSLIYRLKISDSNARVIGTTKLDESARRLSIGREPSSPARAGLTFRLSFG